MGLFAAVNESTWEHIKIALTPTLAWSLVDGLVCGNNPNYFLAKTVSLLVVIVLIPLLFYGHKFIAQKDYALFDIVMFYLVVIASQLTFFGLLQIAPVVFFVRYLACVTLFLIFGCYLLLTLLPIKNFIFKDPVTDKYGYMAHEIK